MTGFLILEPSVRECSCPSELSCLRSFPCRMQLPLAAEGKVAGEVAENFSYPQHF